MDGQDWNPTVISGKRSSGPTAAATASKRISGAAGAERTLSAGEYSKAKTFTPESRQMMVKLRLELKKSQAELNQMCSFPPNTIRELESGRLAPTIGQLNTLNRVLKAGLKLG